jgi:lysyl-tRNA synthetase class 2
MAKPIDAIRKDRIDKLEKLKKLGINPYPSKIEIEGQLIKLAQARDLLGKKVLVAGRIWSIRKHGGVVFFDIRDDSQKIQLLFQEKKLGKDFTTLDLIDTADFIAANGEVIKTPAGEISVDVDKYQFLSKALRPSPDVWYGLKDVEERFRRRYLDLLLNPEVRERFNVRTKLVSEIRNYLDGLGYLEVETPTLQPLYGGANAKPFQTHLNALDVDMYLRIADELYLKRLVVGGYEKVYEICKDFRNEGMDLAHNPEFTMIEYYEAYADYHRVMDVTEGLFKHLAQAIFGKMEIRVGEKVIDISNKWPRIKMVDILKEKLGLDVEKESVESLVKYCKAQKMELVGGETKGQLTFLVFEHKVTDLLIDPVWVIDYPKDVSPLSKDHKEEGWVERFEGYIGGKEICDGWSELTDPREQRKRFEADTKAARRDKEEAQQVDEDFIEAMEYGMPPLGGIGIGIDRLTMFFTNTWSIKEAILFPTMRPKKD